ncbi:MAG: hypothetical protein AUH92_03660 [Acidobacteria bacterium 13_1_40CM_4_69_4]|nr:MAG: hypothetical protein AUH92_03660 [Acidobacteria bacterium 13_1_40CM_4_69_4]
MTSVTVATRARWPRDSVLAHASRTSSAAVPIDDSRQQIQDAQHIVRVDDTRQGSVEEGVALDAQHAGERRVGIDQPIVLEDEDAVPHALDETAVTLLRFTQAAVGLLIRRQVARRHEHSPLVPRKARDRNARREHTAVATLHPHGFGDPGFAQGPSRQLRQDPLPLPRSEQRLDVPPADLLGWPAQKRHGAAAERGDAPVHVRSHEGEIRGARGQALENRGSPLALLQTGPQIGDQAVHHEGEGPQKRIRLGGQDAHEGVTAYVLETGGDPAKRPAHQADAQDREGDGDDARQDGDRGDDEKIAFE